MAIDTNTNWLKQDATGDIALHIASILQGIRFGSIEVVVHDGRIVHIDKRERFRVNEKPS